MPRIVEVRLDEHAPTEDVHWPSDRMWAREAGSGKGALHPLDAMQEGPFG